MYVSIHIMYRKFNFKGEIQSGTTDKAQVFHPFVIAVCKGESSADFAFVFNAVRKFNGEWAPSVLLADACEAITGGFEDVFESPRIRLMCYFHVIKNIEKYMKASTEDESNHIRADIQILQMK